MAEGARYTRKQVILFGVGGLAAIGFVIYARTYKDPRVRAIYAEAEEARLSSHCLTNVKQLAYAHLIYTADWDQQFAPLSLVPSVKSPYGSECPKTGKTFAFNTGLGGVDIDTIPDLESTVLCYEGKDRTLDLVHRLGRASVATADGNGKLVTGLDGYKWSPSGK